MGAELKPFTYPAFIERVVDGDTFDARLTLYEFAIPLPFLFSVQSEIDCGFRFYIECQNVPDGNGLTIKVTHRDRFRMYGINAPEMKGSSKSKGEESKAWLVDRVERKTVTVETSRGQEKFGRWLANIFVDDYTDYERVGVMAVCVNDEMVRLGLATVYKP